MAGIALSLSAGCATSHVWVEAERHLEFDVADAKQLDVHTENGAILVVGEPSGSSSEKFIVDVRIRTGGRDQIEADSCLNAIEIDTVPVAGGHRSIRTRWARSKKPDWRAKVSYEIHMPGRLALHATTDNGRIRAEDVGGECVLESDNGKIDVIGGRGRLRARTANGTIDVATAASDVTLRTNNGRIIAALTADGPVGGQIESENGQIHLTFDPHASTDMSVTTGNGRIRTRSIDLKDLHTTRNVLRGRLGSGGGLLKVRTANGHVTLQSPIPATNAPVTRASDVK